jgi:BON domain
MSQERARTDAEIREAVRERLARDLRIDASGVDVAVSDGAVTLSGTVPEPGQQIVAEADARTVAGVRSVTNQVRLHQDAPFSGEILPANTFGAGDIAVGMPVVGIDGTPVGKVKTVGADDFLVDRPLARDVYVPYAAVLNTTNEWETYSGGPVQPAEVVLTVRSEDVGDQGWRHP